MEIFEDIFRKDIDDIVEKEALANKVIQYTDSLLGMISNFERDLDSERSHYEKLLEYLDKNRRPKLEAEKLLEEIREKADKTCRLLK